MSLSTLKRYLQDYSKHSNPPVFPWSLQFFGTSPGLPVFVKSPGLRNNSKINVQVIETHVSFSDA